MTLTDPRLAYDRLPVLIWTAGADGTCGYLNARWSEFTGHPAAEMMGWAWMDLVHPDDRERVAAEYAGSVAARGPVRLEFRILHQDGDYRWVLGTGEPCYGAGGDFLGYSGCTTDVTDRRAPEQRLAEVGRTSEMAQLAGGIAHEFNNLLTGILGHVALLLEESSLSAEAREDLAQIRHAAGRAATLSHHLLAFSRRPHPAAPERPGETEEPAPGGSETILLVEDDSQVRDVARRALERAGYVVLAASDAEAGIAAADRHPGHIHLLVTDVVLPHAGGRELAARLAIHRPAINVLYVSGTSDGAIARHRVLEPGIEFLEKPFSLDRLLRTVRQVLGAGLSAEDSPTWTRRSLA